MKIVAIALGSLHPPLLLHKEQTEDTTLVGLTVVLYDDESEEGIRETRAAQGWCEKELVLSTPTKEGGEAQLELKSITELVQFLGTTDLIVSYQSFSLGLPELQRKSKNLELKQHYDMADDCTMPDQRPPNLLELHVHTIGNTRSVQRTIRYDADFPTKIGHLYALLEDDLSYLVPLFEFAHQHGYLLSSQGRIPLQVPYGTPAWTCTLQHGKKETPVFFDKTPKNARTKKEEKKKRP